MHQESIPKTLTRGIVIAAVALAAWVSAPSVVKADSDGLAVITADQTTVAKNAITCTFPTGVDNTSPIRS